VSDKEMKINLMPTRTRKRERRTIRGGSGRGCGYGESRRRDGQLTADLEELRQTLLRRQADFD